PSPGKRVKRDIIPNTVSWVDLVRMVWCMRDTREPKALTVKGRRRKQSELYERGAHGTGNAVKAILDVRPAGKRATKAGQGQIRTVREGNGHGNKDINPEAVNVR
uniref:hypothetical protein n=1 Tax=Enterobacter cloacae TaxID=550 RepID=UPI001BD0EE8D